MKTIFLGFQSSADRLCGQPQHRGRAVSLALAVALAASAALPSSAVDNPQLFYAQTIEQELLRLADHFNENLVCDLGAMEEQMRRQWLVRYNAAHPLTLPTFAASGASFYESLFGAQLQNSPDDIAFLNANAQAILQLATQAAGIITELKRNG